MTPPDYATLTRDDPNPLKRFLQGKRLRDAVGLLGRWVPRDVVDYGAGDGELARVLRHRYPDVSIAAFEPTPALFAQAEANLRDLSAVRLVAEAAHIPSASADAIFCLEVFEHLPPLETATALDHITRILKPDGVLIIGVPIEIGLAARFKGAFRRLRRNGDFDTDRARIAEAAKGHITFERFKAEIAPGLAYYPHHLGFDYRNLLKDLEARFVIDRIWPSPFLLLPPELNSELTLRVFKDAV